LNSEFSFVIISFNEEQHLPGLLASIKDLDAAVFLLDSGSTDATLSIAEQHGITVLTHAFENHPRQWDYALQNFDIKTSWVICLDSDHTVTPELKKRLQEFTDTDFKDINGIYFNRKNFFKGSWIKHGGYSPFYLLKMFRYGVGYSDLNENMDHRFIVPGKTIIWKDGYILEENLKENSISFWIAKHNRYSDLVAQEEVERMLQMRSQTLQPNFWGSPDERTAWLKQLWWKLPRYARPMLYLIYRMFFQLGILDGRTGVIFHFLQGFWFRLVVDIKIDEILRIRGYIKETAGQNNNPIRFPLLFRYFLFRLNHAGEQVRPIPSGPFRLYQLAAHRFVKKQCGHIKYVRLYCNYQRVRAIGRWSRCSQDRLFVPGLGVDQFFCGVCASLSQETQTQTVVPFYRDYRY
jgi:glycosyltransferase involved in cell wall biosynthesis